MGNKLVNPCVRCGQERIVLKSWEEEIETISNKIQVVRYTQTICPNKDCQKVVDKEIKIQEDKREDIRLKKLASENARKENALKHSEKIRKQTSRI